MRHLFLLLIIFPTLSFSQSEFSKYGVQIGDSIYKTKYARSVKPFDTALRLVRGDTQLYLRLKINLICDTLPSHAYLHNPWAPDSLKFIISCGDQMSVNDTLYKQTLAEFEKLVMSEVFVVKESQRIKPANVGLMVNDSDWNSIFFDNSAFNKQEVENFMKRKQGNIYGRIVRVEFNDGGKSNVIDVDVAFRLMD